MGLDGNGNWGHSLAFFLRFFVLVSVHDTRHSLGIFWLVGICISRHIRYGCILGMGHAELGRACLVSTDLGWVGLGKKCLIYPFYRLDLLKRGGWMDQSGPNVAEVGEV